MLDHDTRYSETGEPEEPTLDAILQELIDSAGWMRRVGSGDTEAIQRVLDFSTELDETIRQAFIAGALMGRTSCDPEMAMYYAAKLEEDSE